MQTAAAMHLRTGSRQTAGRITGRQAASSAAETAGRNAARMTGVEEMRDLNKRVTKIIRIIERIPVIIMVIKTVAESVRIARRNLKAN